LHFNSFEFFFTIMSFAVLFQKMDPNIGVIINGAEVTHSDTNFSYVADDMASPKGWTAPDLAVKGGRRQDLWRRPPETCHIVCHVGKVSANGTGVAVCYLGDNDDGNEVGVHFFEMKLQRA
jgi:hypothetical protein